MRVSCFCRELGINGDFGDMNLEIFTSHANSKDQVLNPHVITSVDSEYLTC